MKAARILTVSITAISIVCATSGQPDWHVQTSPLDKNLVSVSFGDTLHGWAVTDSGTVIHTVDAGLNWQVQYPFENLLPEKIFFQDKQSGWLAGINSNRKDTAYILHTMDGGSNWDTSYALLGAQIFDVFFINDTMGWAVGFIGDTLGLRLHTIDAGDSWNVQSGINVSGIFSSVHFRDTERGNICGPGPVMMHTVTGGRGPSPWALEVSNLKKPMYDLVNQGELYGCMVGADGKLFFTKDRWVNFIEEDYVEGDTLWSVDAIDPLGFWIVGEAGTILFVGYNEFLGLTIQDQSLDMEHDLVDLHALDDAHAWAVGEGGTILFYGFDASSGIPRAQKGNLRIYPNPARDMVKIGNIPHGRNEIELYSMEGKLMKTSILHWGQTTAVIDLRGLERGTYILKAGEERHRIVVMGSPD